MQPKFPKGLLRTDGTRILLEIEANAWIQFAAVVLAEGVAPVYAGERADRMLEVFRTRFVEP